MHSIIYINKLQILFWEKTRIVHSLPYLYIINVRTKINKTTKKEKKCQNLKVKLVAVKIVLVCMKIKSARKIKSHIATSKSTAQTGGFIDMNFMLARIG